MGERDAELRPAEGGEENAARIDGADQDGSINVSVEELEEDMALALDGEGASAEEQHRAYAFVQYLRGILPRLTHAADAANAYIELAEQLGPVLGDEQGALEACRTAFRKRARDLHVARAYRKAALRARIPREVSTALDAEAKRTTTGTDRAALHVERALLLARHFNNDKAARYAFKHALDAEPTNIIGLMATERAMLGDGDFAGAAELAQKLAATATDPKLRAEHLARGARHLERSGDGQAGLALAASARLDAPDSPAVLFALERLCLSQQAVGMFVSLREHQIADGLVDAASAWYDVGILSAYVLHDDERAVAAFTKAKEAAGDEAVSCLEELAWLHYRRHEFEQASDAIADQLPAETRPDGRAALWHRLARVRGEHLHDEEGTIVALEAALTESPSYYPVLADAGRLFHQSGSRERLIKMHRLEAQAASTASEKGGALRRLGELLIQNESTRDAGIEALREALSAAPGHLSAFVALERALTDKCAWRELVTLYTSELEHTKEPARRAHLHTCIGELASEQLDDPKLALSSLREAVKVDVSSGPPARLSNLAEHLEEAGELEELVPVLSRIAEATRDKSERATVYERLAGVHEKRGRIEDAVLAFKRAVQAAPPSHPAHAAAGRAFLRSERYRDLLEVLEAGLAACPPKEKAMWLQKIAAVQEQHLGRTDDAVQSLQAALEHAPDSYPARQTLIEILTRNQRWAELNAALSGTAHGDPRRALRRGVIAEASGDLATALEHYGRAVEGGSKLARLPLLRVAAAVERWDALERHYGASESPNVPTRRLLHERCRAAEVAHERLQRPADAVRYLTEALGAERHALSPIVSMLPLVTRAPDTQVRLLDLLEHITSDPAMKQASLRLATHAWEACDQPEKALDAHMRILVMSPADPVSLVATEIELERRCDRITLADVLRAASRDKALEPQLSGTVVAALGTVLEQLGRLREATQVLEEARQAAGQEVSRKVLLALHRLYVQLEDAERVPEVLETLAKCPPAGATQAACYRQLAAWWWDRGDADKAAAALRAGLNADPCDYRAINALVELPNVEEAETIDVLMRAFELEQTPDLVATLGTTLAARLLLLGRWHTARETVDRVLANDPDALPALMLLAETHERRKSWELAASALDRIGDHDDASTRIKLEALRRLTNIQVLHLQKVEEARGTAARVAALPIDDEFALRAKLEVDILIQNDESAAKTLDALTSDFDAGEQSRVDDLVKLAKLQDESLGDPQRAVDTLSRISESMGHAFAIPGLRGLGDKNGNWKVVADALEDALGENMAAPWECAVRRRLAQVLREHLNRPKDALMHEKRILELDPSDGPTVARVTHSMADGSPQDAIAHHRRVLADDPQQIASYRALRHLFLAEDDRDGAFCAEAVLVGLGVASEEEEYFYRQRRAKHAGRVAGTLSPVELSLLCPERDAFVVRVAKMVDALIPRMFPLDKAGYGIEGVAALKEGPLYVICHQTAALFGVAQVSVFMISPRMGPCVEMDGETLMLLLPRTLLDAPPREQRFVCGSLLARAAFGGALTDTQRISAFTDTQLEQLVVAALAIGDERLAPQMETAVYVDMRTRLSEAIGHLSLRRLQALAAEAGDELQGVSAGVVLRRAMNRASASGAVLCSGDPAVAIASAVTFANVFAGGDLPERRGGTDILDKLPVSFQGALAFAVSETHAKLRRRLFEAATDDG